MPEPKREGSGARSRNRTSDTRDATQTLHSGGAIAPGRLMPKWLRTFQLKYESFNLHSYVLSAFDDALKGGGIVGRRERRWMLK